MKIRIISFLTVIALFNCNRPLSEIELKEQKTYLDYQVAISNPSKVYKLHLNDTNQYFDLTELVTLNKLQRLDISSKIKLDTFPDFLTSLKNLQWIKIRNNKIQEVDYKIQHFKYLEILELPCNEIKNFPSWLCYNNDKYYTIDFSDNQIKDIPREIGNIKSLEHLSLENNQIKELPLEIGELENLKTLNLMNNNFKELPYTLSNLYQNLEKLYIGGNNIDNKHIEWLKKHLPYTDIDTNIYEN